MAALTPQITLTATLLDYSGNALGSATQPAWLRIALCNFGPTLPCIPGTGNIGKVSSWFQDIPFTGTQITVKLWGNDVITPGGGNTPPQTYYAISILDAQRNVVQTGLYQFVGTLTIDLSSAPQILPGVPIGLPYLSVQPCSGAVPGTSYTAPGWVLMVLYNGVPLLPGLSLPTLSYTLSGAYRVITLNFTTEVDDTIYALCIL
jgi:hypothetical protein